MKQQFLGCLADGFNVLFCSLFSLFLRGMLHLGYAGFISSSCWAKLHPLQPMLGQCGDHVGSCCWLYCNDVVLSLCGRLLHKYKAILAHVGQMLSHVGICWGNVGTIFHIYYWAYLEPFWALCWPLSPTWAFQCRGVLVLGPHKAFAKKYSIYKENKHFFGCLAHVFDAVFNYVCEVFFWCWGGIWMVLLVVYGWSLAGGCLGGDGIACCELPYYGWIFQLCFNLTRADAIHQSCTLVPHDISSAFPVLTGGA